MRPSWSEYFLNIAEVVASRSNCIKRNVGAVIVKDNRILSTGYNGTPRLIKNCYEGGCPRCSDPSIPSGTRLDECLCSHAEENAIAQAAYHGVSTAGSRIYSTHAPCLICAKLIINSGISKVTYKEDYASANDAASLLLYAACVPTRRFE